MTKTTLDEKDPFGFLFGAKFMFLGKNFEAMLNHEGELLVMPSKTGQKTSGITLDALITDLKSLYTKVTGTDAGFVDSIKTLVGAIADLETLEIDLEEMFLHIKKKDGEEPIFEYAFKISLNNTTAKVSSLFAFKSMFFCVWNTENQNIINNMQLLEISTLLA